MIAQSVPFDTTCEAGRLPRTVYTALERLSRTDFLATRQEGEPIRNARGEDPILSSGDRVWAGTALRVRRGWTMKGFLMDSNERRLVRAIRRVPAAVRGSNEEERHRALASAHEAGTGAERVSRGALATATDLRIQQVGNALLGGLGTGPAFLAWGVVACVSVAAVLFGSVFLLLGTGMVATVAFVLARAGVHSHWSHAVMVMSLIVGSAAAEFVWWVWGLGFDAADAFEEPPAIVAWMGPGVIVFLVSSACFIMSVIYAVVHESRLRAHR